MNAGGGMNVEDPSGADENLFPVFLISMLSVILVPWTASIFCCNDSDSQTGAETTKRPDGTRKIKKTVRLLTPRKERERERERELPFLSPHPNPPSVYLFSSSCWSWLISNVGLSSPLLLFAFIAFHRSQHHLRHSLASAHLPLFAHGLQGGRLSALQPL